MDTVVHRMGNFPSILRVGKKLGDSIRSIRSLDGPLIIGSLQVMRCPEWHGTPKAKRHTKVRRRVGDLLKLHTALLSPVVVAKPRLPPLAGSDGADAITTIGGSDIGENPKSS